MTALDEPGTCPDPEVLGAFLEGALEGAAWQAVADHVRQCDECLFVIRGTMAYERQEERETERPAAWLPYAAGIAIAFIAVAAILMMFRTDPMRRMAAAIQKAGVRTFEGRIAGFEHTRYLATRSGDVRNDPALTAAAQSILRGDQHPQSAKAWHAQGIANLLLGHPDSAVHALAEAVRLAPQSAAFRSDLAAARIALGTERDDADEVRRALADSEEAIRLKRTPEALFNRGLALERLRDAARAATAYQEAIAADPHSRWADEARWRVERLHR